MEYRGRPAGTFATPPAGIILHGSRSGKAGNPPMDEFLGTCRWVVANPDGLAWHATIGEHVYAAHLTPREWGWHARDHSREYLGVEFAQPTVNDAITDAQVAAFVAWYRRELLPTWPTMTPAGLLMPAHSETPAGKRDGKSDPFPLGDPRNDELRARIYAALAGPPAPPAAAFAVGAGILAAMRAAGDEPTGPEVYSSQVFGADWLSKAPGKLGLYVYDPAAKRVAFLAWR